MGDPHNKIRKLQQRHDLSYMLVQRILTKKLKFHSYKVTFVQQLNEDITDGRLQFSELMMNKIDTDANFLKRTVLSDEATFFLDGSIERYNMSYWSETNPI